MRSFHSERFWGYPDLWKLPNINMGEWTWVNLRFSKIHWRGEKSPNRRLRSGNSTIFVASCQYVWMCADTVIQCIYIYIYMYVCIIYIYTHMYIYIYILFYIHIFVFVCVWFPTSNIPNTKSNTILVGATRGPSGCLAFWRWVNHDQRARCQDDRFLRNSGVLMGFSWPINEEEILNMWNISGTYRLIFRFKWGKDVWNISFQYWKFFDQVSLQKLRVLEALLIARWHHHSREDFSRTQRPILLDFSGFIRRSSMWMIFLLNYDESLENFGNLGMVWRRIDQAVGGLSISFLHRYPFPTGWLMKIPENTGFLQFKNPCW